MTYSDLTAYVRSTKKYGSRNGKKVKRLVVHHTGSLGNKGNLDYLADSEARVSANYLLTTDKELIGMVSEDHRPWTTGSRAIDEESVTIEVVNTGVGPDWKVSEGQIEVLVDLAVDLAIRHNWGGVSRENVTGHREHKATLCPGPFLFGKLDVISTKANLRYLGKTPVTTPPKAVNPSTPPVPRGTPLLRPGSRGESVKMLQACLNYVSGVGLDVDGIFGTHTKRAVMRMQAFSGIQVDAVYGPKSGYVLRYWVAIR